MPLLHFTFLIPFSFLIAIIVYKGSFTNNLEIKPSSNISQCVLKMPRAYILDFTVFENLEKFMQVIELLPMNIYK